MALPANRPHTRFRTRGMPPGILCKDFTLGPVYPAGRCQITRAGHRGHAMRFGKNIKCVGAWVLVFVVAQGMIYRWGYDRGYLYGSRQGYGDFFEEKHTKAQSDAIFRAEAEAADADAQAVA